MVARGIVASLLFLGTGLAAMGREPAHGAKGMVASSAPLATEVGVSILKRGGNAVDAAVATAFALAVVYPQAGNIGGGGFAVVRDGRTGDCYAIDFREVAPERATPFTFVDAHGEVIPDLSKIGAVAAGVPGSVAGLALLHGKGGVLSWREVVEPAVRLARDGFVVDWSLAKDVADEQKKLARFPETTAIFLPEAKPLSEGTRLVQPDLARALELIRNQGARGFYEGPVAEAIARTCKRHEGLLGTADLKSYHPIVRAPIRSRWRDLELVTMPPSSSGGTTLVEILNVLEPYRLAGLGAGSAMEISIVSEACRLAFLDRARYLGDPDYTRVPVAALTSKGYAARLRGLVCPARPRVTAELRDAMPEPADTTHLSVADAAGNVVALTTTINDLFGSGLVVEGGGFLLNDEMDDFVVRPGAPNMYGLSGGIENSPQPGKRMLSSMCPTIVLKEDKPFLVLGARGGPRIITTVLQVLLNVVEHGMNIADAVDFPRIHHQGSPDELLYEARGLSPDTADELCRMGYQLKLKDRMSDCEAIAVTPEGFRGASDPRYSGEALGF